MLTKHYTTLMASPRTHRSHTWFSLPFFLCPHPQCEYDSTPTNEINSIEVLGPIELI
jgi:hypothetical protein